MVENKVTEPEITSAFLQGVQEGFAQEGETVYHYTSTFEGTQITAGETTSLEQVLAKVTDVLVHHGRGASVTVWMTGETEGQLSFPDDSEVAEAELL